MDDSTEEAVGGRSKDVVNIGFSLEIGDVSGEIDGNERQNIDCNISIVSLPEYKKISDNEIVTYSHWGEVDAGRFYQFLSLEKQLSQIEKKIVSDYWHDLMEENAPLRAIINGKITSVPEDFYDFIIIRNLPENDFIMARFIGKLLGEYSLGISDSWYALRIDKMIEDNKLVVVENRDPSHPYGKVLRKM